VQSQGKKEAVVAYWIKAELTDRACYVFCLSENWTDPGSEAPAESLIRSNSSKPTLVLGVVPSQQVNYWDPRWEEATGLTKADLSGVPSELVLDWLIPNQADRDAVADLFQHRPPESRSLVLEILTPTGSSPFATRWLPVQSINGEACWIVVFEQVSQLHVENKTQMPQFGRSFIRGLSQLLNHNMLKLMDLAEKGMIQADLSSKALNSFEQILDACQRFAQLLDHLECLAMVAAPDLKEVSLNDLIREFVQEQAARTNALNYELALDLLPEELLVRVVPRLVKTVLKQLLTNAEQALTAAQSRRITISVVRKKHELICAIADTGEGLPTENWPILLSPFVSTKGPFARSGSSANSEATGLGLTVAQHLLKLLGGKLELRKRPEGGTIASFSLPCASLQASQIHTSGSPRESIRADFGEKAHGPHEKGSRVQVSEPPTSTMP
jgi:signal transduction histidine kinase